MLETFHKKFKILLVGLAIDLNLQLEMPFSEYTCKLKAVSSWLHLAWPSERHFTTSGCLHMQGRE